MNNIQIKQAQIKDLDTVYSIVRKASQWLKQRYGFKHWSGYYTLDTIKENFTHKIVYLLFKNELPVATYTMSDHSPSYYEKKDINNFKEPNALSYYLTTLCVLPSHQGKGYAKLLISHLEDFARQNKVKYIRFDARGDYKELIQFYTKLGYKITGELDDEGTPYYFLEKEIS